MTVQRAAQGRVTSDYPTIELCARARSFTGGRCKSEMLQLSLLHLPRCNCPLVHTLVTLASLKGLFTLLVLGDVLMEHQSIISTYNTLEMVITHMPHVARSAASLPP